MNEKELFKEVLDYFVKQYNLTLEVPYPDRPTYFIIKQGGTQIGDMNIDGYNLLYNLSRLCKFLENELI